MTKKATLSLLHLGRRKRRYLGIMACLLVLRVSRRLSSGLLLWRVRVEHSFLLMLRLLGGARRRARLMRKMPRILISPLALNWLDGLVLNLRLIQWLDHRVLDRSCKLILDFSLPK